jgi:ABC-type branched-subunit amino acid transport system substrate-binding protein
VALLLATWLTGTPAVLAKGGAEKAIEVVFLAPAEGVDAVRGEEFLLGAQAAFQTRVALKPAIDLVHEPLPVDKQLGAAFKALAKRKVAILMAWVPDGRTAAVERAAEKAKLPLIVVSPEPTRMSIDPKRAVFWAGGLRPHLAAVPLMDYLLQPLGSVDPTLLHDGSERAALTMKLCRAQHHVDQRPKDPLKLTADFDAVQVKKLAAAGTDAFLYCGGPEGAERLLAAVNAAELKIPVLLGQGLVTRAVPTFYEGKAPQGWAVEPAFFEDFQEVGPDARSIVEDAAAAAEMRLLPAAVRGYRVMDAVVAAATAAGTANPKAFVPHLRRVGRKKVHNKTVFEQWGHAGMLRMVAWRSAKVRDDPPCHRLRHTQRPMMGVGVVGFYPTSRFKWQPGTQYVHCTWGEDAKRTIEKDLKILGLHTDGYEADLEKRILDDLMGRIISKVNRLFRRNPDGSAIPGVSYNISLTTEPPPDKVKTGPIWHATFAGDHPNTGGMASGNVANIFTTFIQRTMYADKALKPALSASDRPYLIGRYKWNTSVDANLREGLLRALVDGYSQAMALTCAHELGHVAGCGHDTLTPLSIMNVEAGAGLEFSWAVWIASHQKLLTSRLGLTPMKRTGR